MIIRCKVPKMAGFSFAWFPRKLRDGNWAWLEVTGWGCKEQVVGLCGGIGYVKEYWELYK